MAGKEEPGSRAPADQEPDGGDRAAEMLEVLARCMVQDIARADSEQAKGLLRLCATLLRRGLPLPMAAAEYLADRLEAIEKESEPWGVPLLRRGRGKNSTDAAKQNRAREIAFEYWCQKELLGVKGTAAALDIADRFGVTVGQVEHAWKDYRVDIEDIDPKDYRDWLREQARGAMGE